MKNAADFLQADEQKLKAMSFKHKNLTQDSRDASGPSDDHLQSTEASSETAKKAFLKKSKMK